MSLINQVLKDLDKRNSSADKSKLLSGEVRNPHKDEPKKTTPTTYALVGLMFVAIAYYAWDKYAPLLLHPTPPAPPVAPAPPQSAPPPPIPAPAVTPAATPTLESVTTTAQEATPEPQTENTAQPADGAANSVAPAMPPATAQEGSAISASAAGVMLVLDFPKAVKYKVFPLSGPNRVVIDLEDTPLTPTLERLPLKLGSTDSDITDIRVGRFTPTVTRIVIGLKGAVPDIKSELQPMGAVYRLFIQWGKPSAPTLGTASPAQHFLGMDKELKAKNGKNKTESSTDKNTETKPPAARLRPSRALSASAVESPATDEKAAPPITRSKPSEPIKVMSARQRSDNLYRQSITMIQQGRVVEAKEALRQAILEIPTNHAARQLLVGLLVEEGHQGDAITLLRDGLRIAPDQFAFSMALARLQVEGSDRQGALATLQAGLSAAADDPEYHAFMAALLQRDERHDEAIKHYLVALQANPSMPNWLVGIGISLQAQNKLGDAAEAFGRAKRTGMLTPELLRFVDQRLGQITQQINKQ